MLQRIFSSLFAFSTVFDPFGFQVKKQATRSLRFLEVLVLSGTIQQQSTDHGGCSTFSVASDIQKGNGSLGRKISRILCFCPRPFGSHSTVASSQSILASIANENRN
jgi:hypothetical protein